MGKEKAIMTLKVSTRIRMGEWVCEDGRQIFGRGETATSWCDDNPKLRRMAEISGADLGWELVDDYDGFTPKWRLDFYKMFRCGIHNLLLELDGMGEYGEMNKLVKASAKLGRNPKCGRQFINFLILTAPDGRFGYTIGKRWGTEIVMTCNGGKGHSPFSKTSKYYQQHKYKFGGKDSRKLDNKRRH